jgi:hypothetical protein
MATRYFKVLHKAGAFIEGVFYPPVSEDGDFADSIVPLELAEGAAGPLWGIECDALGNEIGAIPDGVKDKMSTELANRIANGAGQGSTQVVPPGEPNPLKNSGTPTAAPKSQETEVNLQNKESDTRKQTIVDTLSLLDHTKDEDWTEGGKPKVEVVAAASGLDGLTRAEITEAAPDFARKVE